MIPDKFQFKTKHGEDIWTAELSSNGWFVIEINGLKNVAARSRVEGNLASGEWIIVKNMNYEDIPEIKYPGKYETIAQNIGQLVDEKNKAYGDAFNKAGEFLSILYPDGVKPEQYGDMLAIVRVFDKLMRIATAKDALGENPWKDLAGYGILKSEDVGR